MSSTISPGMHPVISALRVIGTGLDELAEGNLWSLLDSEALDVRVELERLSSRLHAARLRATQEVATRGAAIRAGAPKGVSDFLCKGLVRLRGRRWTLWLMNRLRRGQISSRS
jgi:hypothetical protein